jgi:hypothetical protein
MPTVRNNGAIENRPSHYLAVGVLALILAGCTNDPVSTARTDNNQVPVDKLFTHEGCTVYRFFDGGRNHYYSDCRGSTMSHFNCGKGCTRDEEVPTNE